MTLSVISRLKPIQKRIILILCLIIVAGGLGYGIFRFVSLSQEVNKLRATPQGVADAAKIEAGKIAEQVKKLIAVPDDETPTIATVSNADKLKANAFFANAQNGDKVLIYTGAKKAIIFRPGENKIIEVGPISIGTPSATVAAADQPSFVLYNGTEVTGLTKKYETTLKGLVKNATVTDRDNAKKRDYAKSLLVDLAGTKAKETAGLGALLGLEVGALPEGEIKPVNADFLIILAEDKK